MERLVKGLLTSALDVASSLLEESSNRRNHENEDSTDRSTWAEVAAGNQTENEGSRRQQPHSKEHSSETYGGRRPAKYYQTGEEQKKTFKKNAGEQSYSDSSSNTDIEPTEEELNDISKACNRIWELDNNRLSPGKDYEIDCGEGKKIYNKNDMAQNSLFRFVNENVFQQRPTYARFYALLDNYHADQKISENFSSRQEQEQTAFIEEISRTAPVKYLFNYLKARRLVQSDFQEFKRTLDRLWFDLYRRDNIEDSSSAFEHVFVGEVKNNGYEVSGLHNWIQFYIEEAKGNLDYQGYVFPRSRGRNLPDSDSQLITVQFKWKEAEKPESSTFIGVSPEFEIALFSLCFFCGEEDNHLTLGPYAVNIKCYHYGRNRIGSVYPIAED